MHKQEKIDKRIKQKMKYEFKDITNEFYKNTYTYIDNNLRNHISTAA